MLEVLGTYNGKIGSRAIKYFLDEPIAHIAFMFDHKMVIHSHLQGVDVIWADDFCNSNTIHTSKPFNLTLEQEEEVYRALITVAHHDYDKKAFAYFAYAGFKKKVFKTPLPKENPWGEKNKYLCTELAGLLPDFIFRTKLNPFKGRDLEMITPYQVVKEIC